MDKKPSAWVKILAVIVAVLILLFAGIQTAKSFGVDVWDAVIQWSQESFSLKPDSQDGGNHDAPSKENAAVFNDLKDALESYGMDSSIIPTWIPDGYVQDEVRMMENPMQRQIKAKYTSEEGSIKFSVVDYLGNEPHYIEQSGAGYEIYEKDGVLYYLTENSSQLRAAWITDGYECHIIGPLTTEQLKQMIDSIEK